jgi:hypothetical protein
MQNDRMKAALRVALCAAGALLLGAAWLGCASPSGDFEAHPRVAAESSQQSEGSAHGGAPVYPIVVGIEHVLLTDPARIERVARMLASIGAPAAGSHCEHVAWGEMQPRADAEVDFHRLDAFVRTFQAAGFRELQICLGTYSEWGSRGHSGRLRARAPVPRPEHMDAFAHWVGALVERYDGDGLDDMPALRNPVRVYVLGQTFSGFGDDFPEAYLAMLERAHRAAHAASSEVVLAHAAFLTTGALRDLPGGGCYEAAFASLSERISTRRLADLRRILDRPDVFDALNVHALGDATEIDAMLTWLRWETDRRGYFKPVIVSEAAPAPLIGWGPATRCEGSSAELGLVLYPAVESDRCRLAGLFRELVDGRPEAVAWARGRAASDLVKKVIVAADRGAWWLNAAPIEDAEWWKRPAFEAGAGVSAWGGFLDVRRDQRRPVYWALHQLLRRLRGRERVQRLSLGLSDVRLYALDGPAGRAWIAWYEPGFVALPEDPTPTRAVSFPTGARRIRVEPVITRPEQTDPDSRLLESQGGIARLELTPTPVLVFPEP